MSEHTHGTAGHTATLHDLVGSGWAFPGRITASGGLALLGGQPAIEAAIRVILGTTPGERVMRPEFGCALWEQVFAPIDPGTLGLMEKAVHEALARWEPRIDIERITATPSDEEGCVQIRIEYVLRSTNDRRNLVYPFYVIPREEERP